MHTPASVHDGSWAHVQARRAATLRAAYEAHPERFRGRCPQPRPRPARVWINEPPATIEAVVIRMVVDPCLGGHLAWPGRPAERSGE
jgi:hypothetical protein